jgi:hypothetical protein
MTKKEGGLIKGEENIVLVPLLPSGNLPFFCFLKPPIRSPFQVIGMKMDAQTIRNLVSLGYMARENGLDMEDVVEMVERGFVALEPQRQMALA